MKEPIKLFLNKRYVVIDYRNNTVIAFTSIKEEANTICSTSTNYEVYEITNEITCYSNI